MFEMDVSHWSEGPIRNLNKEAKSTPLRQASFVVTGQPAADLLDRSELARRLAVQLTLPKGRAKSQTDHCGANSSVAVSTGAR